MVSVKIFAKDNALPGNRDMITWVESKFDNLVSAGLRFTFKILDDADIKKLTTNGINKLPVMFLDGKSFTGSIDIQNSLQGYLRGASRTASSGSNALDPAEDKDVEQFRNWQLGEMSKERRDEDARDTGDDNTAEIMKQRASEAAEARAKRHQQENVRNKQRAAAAPTAAKTASSNPSSRPDNIVMPKLVDKDDILLARMMETT